MSTKMDVLAHTYIPRICEAEAEGWLLSIVRLCFKKKKRGKKKRFTFLTLAFRGH